MQSRKRTESAKLVKVRSFLSKSRVAQFFFCRSRCPEPNFTGSKSLLSGEEVKYFRKEVSLKITRLNDVQKAILKLKVDFIGRRDCDVTGKE